jgi:hypothetical protein
VILPRATPAGECGPRTANRPDATFNLDFRHWHEYA